MMSHRRNLPIAKHTELAGDSTSSNAVDEFSWCHEMKNLMNIKYESQLVTIVMM